jgi:uncharacterized membrane protein
VTGDPYGGAAGSAGGYGAGGYGAPPTDPYGQPPAGGGSAPPYSPTEAISYGWKKFAAAPASLLVPMLLAWIGVVVVAVVIEVLLANTVLGTHSCDQTILGQTVPAQCGPSTLVRLIFSSLGYAITFMVLQILTAGIWRGALRITDGHSFGVGELFEGFDKAQVVLTALLVAVGTFIGLVLCIIPGIIFAFLTMFAIPFVVDKQMPAVDAIKASIQLVRENVGPTLLYFLLAYVVTLVGACLCGVGLLVAYPVVLVGYAYTFRRLQSQPVSPA